MNLSLFYSRFESSDYFCSNLLNKFINNHDNNRENDPNETTLQRQFAQNRQDLILNHASARPVNSAPYYYGDIAYRQPFTRYTNHSDISNINLLNSNGDWNRASIKYSIMDGLRVGIKNQVRQSNQYLRSPNVNRSDEFNVSLRGWLYRLEGAAIKQWKRRWCVLADYCLFYYKDMAEEKMLGSLLLPSYKISPCFSSDGISRKFAFKAEHNNMKTYYFSADSKEIQQQWMNALSMASIMQLSAIFSAQTNNVQHQQNNNNLTNHDPSNNQINTNDPHDHNNNDERKESISDRRLGPLSTSSVQDDESGFIAYHQTKRLEDSNVVQQLQQQPIYPINNYDGQNFLPTAAMYQQMAYNGSMGLPIYYPNHPHHHHIHSQLNNGEYINAPPKPQRHYYDLMLPYDLQDHHHHHQHQTYKIYHGQMDPNFINQNYFIIANEQNFMPYHTDISSDFNYVPQQQQSHSNQFDHDCFNQNVEHSHQQQLQLEQLQRLPPRPHSADFLERNQDYELDDEECETLFASNNNNKSGDSFNNDIVNQDSRIMPIRPKSSIEKYDNYHHNGKGSYVSYNENYQSKFDPYMAKNFYQTSHNDNADNSIIPVSLKKTNIVDKLNNAHIVTDTTTIPNRPPLPQEYVFRFQQQNTEHTQNIDDLVGLPKTQSTSIKREKNITTYTSDDEKAKTSNSHRNAIMDSDNNDDPFELSKEEYQKASKLFFQRQLSCSRTLNSTRNDMAKLSSKQPNPKDDWNEIGLPMPIQNVNSNDNGLFKRINSEKTNPGNFDVQNQSNEELEIKFKLGLNVRTYRKPKLSNHCPSTTLDDNDSVHKQLYDDINKSNNNQNNSQNSTPTAPYYYSDLLNEEQKIALQKKLGDFAEPPPLLSRCTALNNTRFLGTTSLTLDKKLSNRTKTLNTLNNLNDGDEKKDSDAEKRHYSSLPKNNKVDLKNFSTTSPQQIKDDNNHPTNRIDQTIIFSENVNENNHEQQQQPEQQSANMQPIYENCTETKSPIKQAPSQVSAHRQNSTNNKKQTRKTLKNKNLNNADSLDSLHQVPIETSKKKRRKRKSRENLNNASDSEIQFTDEKGKSNTFDRASRKYFLKSSRRFSVSAAEYVGRRHEELILMLIQLRRKQSQLAKTCEKLRLQMDSEEKMMEIEPYRKDDYQLRFNELSRKWKELNELNKKKAASTSILDRVTVDDDQFNLVKKDRDSVSSDSDSIRTAETPNENIEILKRQQKVLEGELDRVRGMLTHSTRKLEEKAVENARMEQEMLLARNKLKQVLENEQEAMEITRSSKLEAELVHINKVIDDLHNRRKELNNAIENLKNSETKFMADRFNDDNVYSDYHKFTNEELKMAVNNAAETSLYPLYENIKKSQAFLSNQNSLQIDHRHVEDDNDGDNDNEDDDNFDRTNNNNLNDEFFTLNINLDKHHTNLSSTSRISTNLNEINNNFPSNIQTMCEFDPNKVMTMTYGGDSIVDQQLKQIYNYHHQPVIIQQPSTKSNEVKTVREVKRESERRKFNHHQQQRTSTSSYNIVRTNYDSYLQTNHYFNHNDNAMTTELKSIDQQMKFDTDTVIDHLTSSPSQNFNTPDIVQSTIKLTDKT
ncbi:Pleckstrin y domaincontaining A member 5 [Dermatophagoides farinae]|uniref:Pleckstrin y domaincontaining A member 5 n=1 Tax=Dermatophagoides farinae TaxID=6954 RepID=A0A922L7S6_DERFA|nr:Pleckstrin y domaincontaining A member 5 [Dermatophagoides farinae]